MSHDIYDFKDHYLKILRADYGPSKMALKTWIKLTLAFVLPRLQTGSGDYYRSFSQAL